MLLNVSERSSATYTRAYGFIPFPVTYALVYRLSKMGVGILSGTKVLVGDGDTKSLLNERGFGELDGKRLVLSLAEALYLHDTEKLEVMKGGKKMSAEELIKEGTKSEKEFYNKYLVYKDLRESGLTVRTGLKFGTDYRLYDRGAKIGSSHSKTLVHVIPEEYTCSMPEMARALRLAKNVNKKLIYAIVDEEGDITYYLVDRYKP